MEKTIDKTNAILDNNERIIANILHDVKSPLYSIKMALVKNLNCQLNKDIFETTINIINYIENFLVNYSFKIGKFEQTTTICDIKKIINQKLENNKYIFINKNIHIDIIQDDENYLSDNIEIFLSSIIGNIISNIAFHAKENEIATIELLKRRRDIIVIFENKYSSNDSNFNLGMNFSKELTRKTNTEFKLQKTDTTMKVILKIPEKIK